jgi:release factor glutamine methyltransferase
MPTSRDGDAEVEPDLDAVTARLREAGFVAARDEATELLEASRENAALLASMIERRVRGEPLAWITGSSTFCGMTIRVDPGVYVPRWQSESLVRSAVSWLPEHGTAIDLCTGSGAIAKVLRTHRPNARVVATDLDALAVACASSNGVEAYLGDLFAPLPLDLLGEVDVIVGVVPYVPTPSLKFLPRDTLEFESPRSYDGGPIGLDVLRRVVDESPRFLRPGGRLLIEVGGDQAEPLQEYMERSRYRDFKVVTDEDGDVRSLEATLLP